MRQCRTTALTILTVLLLGAASARAEVALRFTPMDTTVRPDSTARLSVMLDDTATTVRTVDLYVTYDPAVVTSVAGGPGAAFTTSGFFLFPGFENDTPGQWHGYCVILGAGDFLSDPGELFWWEFTGLADGESPIIAVEVNLSGGDGVYYPDVALAPTSIIVHDPPSAVSDTPPAPTAPCAWPNPFNPITFVRWEQPAAGPLQVAVFDARGRRVALLHDGAATAGPHVFRWDGRDAAGRLQPAGPYLVRCTGPSGSATAKVTMVK